VKSIARNIIFLGLFILFSQIPHFVDLYTVRLSSHLSELTYEISELDRKFGKDIPLTVLAEEWKKEGSKELASLGVFLQDMHARKERLSHILLKLENSPSFVRPIVVFVFPEGAILKETIGNFVPGVAFTFDTFLWGSIGILFGMFILYFGSFLFRRRKTQQQ
jgi:hypothetical protein